MPAPTTEDKVMLVMRELNRRRADGRLGMADPVTPREMAAVSVEIGSPVCERTFRRIEADALCRLRHHPLAALALSAIRNRQS